MKLRIAVLGAGIQGTCVALEAAARGHHVDLYDRNAACVTQTSAQNEGKIHLGLVYANDPSRQTARMMLRGALSFAPLMRSWLGEAFNRVPVSTSFLYAVNVKSLLTVEEIRGHFGDCAAIAAELGAPPRSYFDRDVCAPPRQLAPMEWREIFDPRNVAAVFATEEIAIDPEAVAALIREVVSSVPEIHLRLQTVVQSVSLEGDRATVAFEAGGKVGRETYDRVVNALWDGRLAVDASVGHVPSRPWLWRLRRNLRVERRVSSSIPSTTSVLGPFGDVVNFGNGALYLSWYPSGRVGLSRGLTPVAWEAAALTTPPAVTQAGIVDGLSGVIPAVHHLLDEPGTVTRLTEGIVFAWGATDINDPASNLHQRYEIGVHSYGPYHSIDTGKYCLAPYFARAVVARMLGEAPS